MIKDIVLRAYRSWLGGCGGPRNSYLGVTGCDNTLWVFSFDVYNRYVRLYLTDAHNYTIIIIGYILIADIICVVIFIIFIA